MSELNLIALQGRTYQNFIDAIKSPKSKVVYASSLKRYMNFLKVEEVDSLLSSSHNPRLIESQIIDYIMTLRNDGLAYATIQAITAPVLTFYALNDVTLNKRKISRYFGEYKRRVKDRAYTAEEIHKALQTADQRMKLIILLLSSTGQRIGSLTDLTLGNLTKIEEYGLYKLVVYEGTNNEYYCYMTRECSNTLDDYLAYRQRYGEHITYDSATGRWQPESAPLLRIRFDPNDLLQVKHPQPMKLNGLRKLLAYHLVSCGLRTIEHPKEPQSLKRVRKSVALGNGFRKFTISSFVKAKINHDIRQLLVDHKGGYLDDSYLRLTEEEVLAEYLHAEPYLTIDPNVRLSQEIQTLRVQKSEMDMLKQKMEEYDKVLAQFMEPQS